MRSSVFGVALIGLMAAGLTACGGGRKEDPRPRVEEWHAPVTILRHFAGPDGSLTLKQLNEGLRRDFDAADTNHDGVLEPDEMRAVNQERWVEDQSAISPLQDWNGDGVIDFNEFAATARALFNEADPTGKGVIPAEVLRPKKPTPDAAPDKAAPEQGSQPHKRRGGQPPQGDGSGG